MLNFYLICAYSQINIPWFLFMLLLFRSRMMQAFPHVENVI